MKPTTKAGQAARAATLTLSDAYFTDANVAHRMARAIDAIDPVAIETEARAQERERILALVFDLPIGNSVDYSRGYSAAISEIRRAIGDES